VTVEFMGGPLDGDLRDIPDGTREWCVFMCDHTIQVWGVSEATLIHPIRPRVGVYTPGPSWGEFHWQGER
jgi:hypothetical protein